MTYPFKGIRVPYRLDQPMTLVEISSLSNFQEQVGGWLEVVRTVGLKNLPRRLNRGYLGDLDEPLVIATVDEEGIAKGLPVNLRLELFALYQGPVALRGDAVIVSEGRVDEGRDFVSLCDDTIEKLLENDSRLRTELTQSLQTIAKNNAGRLVNIHEVMTELFGDLLPENPPA